jgi:Dehydrogenases with different specificities (related to short-chain alcohol dehydrogenases)
MSIIDRFRLTGKKAIVTGAAQGIGHHVAIALAEAGADVALFDLNEASETQEKIRALGREAFCVKMSVADEAAVEAAYAEVDARFGGVDILFNNAGICI